MKYISPFLEKAGRTPLWLAAGAALFLACSCGELYADVKGCDYEEGISQCNALMASCAKYEAVFDEEAPDSLGCMCCDN